MPLALLLLSDQTRSRIKRAILIYRTSGFWNFSIKVCHKIGLYLSGEWARIKGGIFGTFNESSLEQSVRFDYRVKKREIHKVANHNFIPNGVLENYLKHRFDILGSGWVNVYHGMKCRGMEGVCYSQPEGKRYGRDTSWIKIHINRSNRKYSKIIFKKIDENYIPIDWQLDFKSGHRWSEKRWAQTIKIFGAQGVDIKVPWELARMQHLPQLALCSVRFKKCTGKTNVVAREIRNQILDFICHNPPSYGVNWVCPMDVAIRAVNWCFALDILGPADKNISDSDRIIITRSLIDHGRFIYNNLEWSEDRNNHYLSNICGLVVLGSYILGVEEATEWLQFGISELQTESINQFWKDGSNFEDSTAYHRLSTEMILYATALILGIDVNHQKNLYNKNRKNGSASNLEMPRGVTLLNDCFIKNLNSALNFHESLIMHNGQIPQIGDNDSGRFVKFAPIYSKINVVDAKLKYKNLEGYLDLADSSDYFFEEHCSGVHLIYAGTGLRNPNKINKPEGLDLEQALVRCLARGKTVSGNNSQENDFGVQAVNTELIWRKHQFPTLHVKKQYFYKDFGISDPGRFRFKRYPNFGIYLWRSNRISISIRAIEEARFVSGHGHCDQLGVDIWMNRAMVIGDPGSYVYSPNLRQRNRYRGKDAHLFGGETESQLDDCFGKIMIEPVLCLESNPNLFCGKHRTGGSENYLLMAIESDGIVLRYAKCQVLSAVKNSVDMNNINLPYSPGYGIQLRN